LQEHPKGSVAPAGAPNPPIEPHPTTQPDASPDERAISPPDASQVAAPADAAARSDPGGTIAPTPRDAGTANGAGISINGVWVPKDKAIVFIHFGHSNMAGHGQNPASLQPYFYTPQPGLWSYLGGGKFVAAKEQTAPDPPGQGAGPGMAWLRAAAAAAGPDYQFISVARARGSAASDVFVKGGLYYSTFMDRALELKGKVTFAGVFVMLGITERHLPMADQGGFADRMTKIVADIRADLGEPNLPVLHTDYEVTATGDLGLTGAFATRFRPILLTLPARISNLVLVPTDGITLEDDHHFTLTGQKTWAERGVQLMITRGWFPWKRP
jgi:hypothetical protein